MYCAYKNKRFLLIILTALLFPLGRTALATTCIIPTDDNLVITSRAIVRAKVLSVESSFDRESQRVWTYTTLRIFEVLKGHIHGRKITIKEEGGVTAERGSIVYGTPEFKPDEQVILYLDTWLDGSFRVQDMFLGKYEIVTDPKTGQQYAQRAPIDANVVTIPTASQSSEDTTERMELSAYLQRVRDKVTANAASSQAYEQTYYSNVPMLTEPPEFQGLKQKSTLEPQWTYIGPAHPRWFEPDSGQPVVFLVDPAGAPNQQVMNDINAAMNAWSTVPGCSLRVANGGTTTVPPHTQEGSYSSNVIYFNNQDDNWTGGGCQNILAQGGLSWFPGQTKVINGVTFSRGTSGFISFNPFAACSFGNSCNVQEITTHEMGHSLGLGHSWQSGFPGTPTQAQLDATMYWIAHFDGRCASIRQDDIDGITFIYPASGGGSGPLAITTSALPGGNVNTAYNQTLIASGGTQPYTWSLASGALPAGLSLSSGGTISGTPTTATTANFTVQVRDGAQTTVQRAFTITIANAAAQYDAQFISQTVPASVQPGQTFSVNMKFLNTGTQPWTAGSTFNFYLASQNPALNQTWGGNGVDLTGFPTSPQQTLNLTFNVTAPATPGTYNFQWQVYQNGGIGFFGQMSPNVAIQVGSAPPPVNGATFLSQTVPSSMTVGQSYSVTVTMQNSGTTTWAAGTYKLGSQNPQDNMTWGTNRVTLANSVAPGANGTFTFNVTAPSAAGTYNFQWQMNDGSAFFGAMSTNASISVSGAAVTTNNADFVSQNTPSTMVAGQVYTVTVVMKNTGTSTWDTPSGFRLGSQNPNDNTTWGTDRVNVLSPIAPGANASFGFHVLAPSTAGTYSFQWRLIKQDTGWFGTATPNFTVTVQPTADDTDNDGIPNAVEPTVGTNPNVKDNAVFTNSRLFVMQQYRDFLNREADSAGLQYWMNQLDTGQVDRATVISQFFTSTEFQTGTAPITRLYLAYFLRLPDYEGLRYWLGQYRNGVSLASISDAFAQSPEFIARYGNLNNGQFVTLLYQNVLGRQPDPQGSQFWLNNLNAGQSRGFVMLGFSESAEYKQVSLNQVYVVQMYLGMLRQIVTQERYTYWLGVLNNGTATTRDLTLALLNSPEYHNRFLP